MQAGRHLSAPARVLLVPTPHVIWTLGSILVVSLATPPGGSGSNSALRDPIHGWAAIEAEPPVAGGEAEADPAGAAAEVEADAPTAADVLHAPLPGEVSGLAQAEEATRIDEVLLWGPRAVFWLPRRLLGIAVWPLRKIADLTDAIPSDPPSALKKKRASGFGVRPIVSAESELGWSLGAQVAHHDAYGAAEVARLTVALGGRYDHAIELGLDSGERFRDAAVEVEVASLALDDALFYGIGNLELAEPSSMAPGQPADGATLLRYHHRQARGALALRRGLSERSQVRLAGELSWHRLAEQDFGSLNGEPLVGVGEPYVATAATLGFLYDTRHPAHPWISEAAPSSGWMLRAQLGLARGPGDRYGTAELDVARAFDLWAGTRVVTVRHHVAVVVGERSELPLVALPTLGGPWSLRGYPRGRFRDRIAMLSSVEYRFPIYQNASAYLLADAGRVFAGAAELSVQDYRFSWGGGVELYGGRQVRLRLQGALTAGEGGAGFFSLGANAP